MGNMSDGLNMRPRVAEPESSLMPGMAAPAPRMPQDGRLGVEALDMPDTSGPGAVQAPTPAHWVYDFDPGTGSSRATYNGEVSFVSGGAATAGVTSWNTRTGAVSLTLTDVTAVGGAPSNSPTLLNGNANTPPPGDATTKIATTLFVGTAIAAASPVSSFNGRTGAVTLTTGDVTGAGGAPVVSPALTGVPTTPTPAQNDASSKIASTMFVSNALASGTVNSFNGRTGAVALTLSDVQSIGGAPIASPNFTGLPSGPTAAPGTATTQLASTAFVENAIVASTGGVSSFNTRTGAVALLTSDITAAGGAPIISPNITGSPTAPTPTAGDNSTKLATTAFVGTAIGSLPPGVATFNGRSGVVALQLTDVTSVGGAPLASPVFTGTPQSTTPTPGDNSIRVATTAFVAAAVPLASTTTPIMDGTAAIGSAATFAKADHVHPTDTTRYAASNPSGYQTAAQVTASLGNYLPLAGGTLTGQLNGTYLTLSNIMTALGYATRAGSAGAVQPNSFNIDWVGPFANLWIQNVNVGQLAFTSDYRIKKGVAPLPSTWDRVKALNPISYSHQDYTPEGFAAPLVIADDVEHWGFIAHELQEALTPSAASGVKDSPTHIQSPNPWTVLATVTKALQEAIARIETQDVRIGGLEAIIAGGQAQ